MTWKGISSRGKNDKHMTECSASLAVREMQVKNITRYHDTTRHPQLGSVITLHVGDNMTTGNLQVVRLNWCHHLGRQLALYYKAEFSHTISPSNCAPESILKRHSVSAHMSTTASFRITYKSRGKLSTVRKNWKMTDHPHNEISYSSEHE